MIFKKNIKAEVFLYTLLFLLLLGAYVFFLFYINPSAGIIKIITINYKSILIGIAIYVVIIVKIYFDRKIIYIIQNNKIVLKNFNVCKEIDINHIDTIFNSFTVNPDKTIKNRYFLIIKGSEITPIRIRQDMYNEDGKAFLTILEEKHGIKLTCRNDLDLRM